MGCRSTEAVGPYPSERCVGWTDRHGARDRPGSRERGSGGMEAPARVHGAGEHQGGPTAVPLSC